MLITVTAATVEPVTLAEAKADLRMTHSEDDVLIGRLIASARAIVEQWTGVSLAAATYQQTYGDSYGPLEVPLLPATVSSVTHLTDNVRGVLAGYVADGVTGSIASGYGKSLVVEFTTAPGVIPAPLKSAILLLVRREYEADPDEQGKLWNTALACAHMYRRTLGV